MKKTTYFGLAIVDCSSTLQCVRCSDIERLPFHDFWTQSALGSGLTQDSSTGEFLVYLADWETFAALFIATGHHRYMKQSAPRKENDKHQPTTYFGRRIMSGDLVRTADIKELPFFDYWQDSIARRTAVPLRDWEAFAQGFIKTGR